jgi:hypothetical protein
MMIIGLGFVTIENFDNNKFVIVALTYMGVIT